ncbi:MAG TPA: 50S ribosome-binding protein YggL, partial [Pseudomonas sp.]|nr:50S ribosome-binding protein YggL [Pseudomonas sp.]
MARSRRLRKKLCVDEFQELGFEVQLNYRDGISDAERNAAMDDFLDQAIEANGL